MHWTSSTLVNQPLQFCVLNAIWTSANGGRVWDCVRRSIPVASSLQLQYDKSSFALRSCFCDRRYHWFNQLLSLPWITSSTLVEWNVLTGKALIKIFDLDHHPRFQVICLGQLLLIFLIHIILWKFAQTCTRLPECMRRVLPELHSKMNKTPYIRSACAIYIFSCKKDPSPSENFPVPRIFLMEFSVLWCSYKRMSDNLQILWLYALICCKFISHSCFSQGIQVSDGVSLVR